MAPRKKDDSAPISKEAIKAQKENKKLLDEWIASNKELWNKLSKPVQDQLKATSALIKSTEKVSSNAAEVRDLASETGDLMLKNNKATKKGVQLGKFINNLGDKALRIGGKQDAITKKQVKALGSIVDISSDFITNLDAIGTEEFQNLDYTKRIREAKKLGMTDEVLMLQLQKTQYDMMKKMNDEIKEAGKLMMKPFETVDEMIGRIPLIGPMLQKVFDVKGIGEDIVEGFKEGAAASAKEMMGFTDVASGVNLDTSDAQMGWNEFQSSMSGEDMGSSERASAYEDYKAQFDISEDIGDSQKNIGDEVAGQGKGAGNLGKKFGKLSKSMKASVGIAIALGAAIVSWGVAQFKFSKELGVSFGELGAMSLFAKEETKALLDEFGSLRDTSNGLLLQMKWQSFWTGVQASDMAKIMVLQESITGLSKEQAMEQQAKWMKEFRKEGLSASKIMSDMASSADFISMYMKDGGQNMKDAAKQAAKMGLSLSESESVANSLLDWESSINKEMEASVLLGRSLNLDKARQLAYNGDIAEMMQEVKMQAGGEAEFAKMSVVQRQALGEAIGLGGAKLAEFMKESDNTAKRSNSNLLSSMGKFAGIAAIVLGTIGGIMGALTITGVGFAGLAAMGMGALKGIALGGLIGAAGGAVMTAFGGGGKRLGGAAGSPVIVGEEGPEIFDPQGSGRVIPNTQTENLLGGGANSAKLESQNSEIITLLKQRNEQAEIQSRDGIRATKDVGSPR